MSLLKERPLRSWLNQRRLGTQSSSPATLREIYTRLTPFERLILRNIVRKRRLRPIDIGILPIEDILEEIDEYIKEQLRLARWRRRGPT